MSDKDLPEGSSPDVSFFASVSPRRRASGRRNRRCRLTHSDLQRSFPFLPEATDLSEASTSEGSVTAQVAPQLTEAPAEVSPATELSSRPTPASKSPRDRLEALPAPRPLHESRPLQDSRNLVHSSSPTGQHAAQTPRWTIGLCLRLLNGLRGLRNAAERRGDGA
jgi:hypothetical protein